MNRYALHEQSAPNGFVSALWGPRSGQALSKVRSTASYGQALSKVRSTASYGLGAGARRG